MTSLSVSPEDLLHTSSHMVPDMDTNMFALHAVSWASIDLEIIRNPLELLCIAVLPDCLQAPGRSRRSNEQKNLRVQY